eukprot:698078-Hanusia_phi.AAC.1
MLRHGTLLLLPQGEPVSSSARHRLGPFPLFVVPSSFLPICFSQFWLQAFDVLERLDSLPEYWEGKKGAFVGAFQM